MGITTKTLMLWGLLKIPIFREVQEKPMYREELRKHKGLRQFADLRVGLKKKEGVVLLRGVDTSMHTLRHKFYTE